MIAVMLCGFAIPQLMAQDEQKVVTVADGTTTNSYVPFYSYYMDNDNHSQVIYPESMLAEMISGQILQMQFHPNFTSVDYNSYLVVKLGISENDQFTTEAFDNSTEMTLVFQGALNVQNGLLTIVFDQPFDYEGGNLLFDIEAAADPDLGYGEMNDAFYGVSSPNSAMQSYGSYATRFSFIPKTTFTYTGGALCGTPSGLIASNVTMDGATITWSESENYSSYTVQWMPSSSTDWSTAEESTVYSNSIDISGLNASSAYKVRVQLNCSDETTTPWSSVYTFNTSCGAIDVSVTPWFEDFEAYPGNGQQQFTSCWNIPLKPNGPFVYCGHAQSCHSGYNSAEFKGQPAYIILPEFEQDIESLRLTFWATATSTSTGNVKVGVVTDPNDYNTFIEFVDAGVPGPRGGYEGVAGNGNLMGPFDFNTFETDEELTNARIALYYTSTNSSASWNLDDFTVSLIPDCAEPGGLATVNVNATSVDVTWNEVEGTTYDLLYWETANSDDQTVLEGVTLTDGIYTIDGINASTQYTWTLRTDCGGGDYATAYQQLTFKTPGMPVELPYERTFEEDAAEISEFTFQGTGSNQWAIGTATFKAEDGEAEGHSLYISNDNGVSNAYNSSSTSNAYAIIDVAFDNTPMEYHLTFDYKVVGESGYDDFSVYVMNGGSEVPTSSTPSGTAVINQKNNVSDWTHVDYILENVIGSSKKIVFYWRNDGYMGYNPPAAIDNIRIIGNECGTPSNLTVSDVTPTSAVLAWTENGTSTDWTVYWKKQGSSEEYNEESVSGEPEIELSSLEVNTAYQFYVISNCDGGESESGSSPVSTFMTSCEVISVAEVAWTSDFEGTDAEYLNCWVSPATGSRNGNTYPHIEPTSSIAHGGNAALEIAFGNIVTALPVFEEEISSLELTFWGYQNAFSSGYANNIELGYITDPYDATTFVPTDTFNVTTYTRFVKQFSALADLDLPATTRIAFRFNQGSSSNLTSWYLDDMQVSLVPTCNAPLYNSVSVSNVTAESAEISFTDEDSSHDAWVIYYRPANSSDDYETAEAASTEGNLIEGLTQNTTYTVFVKTVCDGQIGENQTDAKTFTTTTIPAELPFEVDFENEEENASWVLLNGTQTNKWYIGTDTAATVNTTNDGETALYISNDGGSTNAYSNSENRVYAYRDILVPDGTTELQLSFDWKANGRSSSYEFLRVYWLDPTVNITAGNNPPSGYDASAQPGNYGPDATEHWLALKTEWQHVDMVISSEQFEGMGDGDKVYRLAFHWRNYSNWNSVANPPAAVDNVILKAVECFSPANVEVSDITENTATVSWAGDADEYSVIVTQGSISTYQTTSANSIELSDLISSTNTTVTIRSLCGDDSSMSVSASFATSCGTITITEENPFFEDFESYPGAQEAVELSPCWPRPETYQVSNGMSPFVYVGYTLSCHSGGNSVEFKGPSAFVLPEFTNGLTELRLSFWATSTYPSYSGSTKVGYITDVNDIETFVELFDAGTPGPRGGNESVSGYGNYMGPFDFIGLEIPEGARIALRHIDANASYSSSQSWNIDDIKVELIPDCPSPVKTSVTFENITAHTATVSWTDNDESHTSWTVFYKPSTAEEWESEEAYEQTLELTGLAPETSYQVYVITNCGDTPENPDATVTKTFTTTIACPAPTGLTFSNVGMTSATVSWTGNADTYIVSWGDGETETVYENSIEIDGLEASTSYQVSVVADCGEEDGMSQPLTGTFNTSACEVEDQCAYTFELADSYGDGWNGNALVVKQNGVQVANLTISSGSSANYVLNLCDNVETEISWVSGSFSYENSFSVYAPDGTLLLSKATQEMSGVSTGTVLLSFTTDCNGAGPVVCNAPTNLVVTATTENTANVTWTPGGNETEWLLQYKLASSATYSNDINVNNNPQYLISGLASGTDYHVRVKAICSANNESDWSSTISFTTTSSSTPVEPTVSTNNAEGITQTSATLYGEITDAGNQTITARGFEWKAVAGGTVATVNAAGTTTFSANLTGLTAATEYTFRAFATTANGNSYGEWKNFTTLNEDQEPCNAPTNVTVTDFDKNSITITWDANGAEKWAAQYRKQGSTAWTMGSNNITSPTYTFSGLEEATIYEYQVQAVCDGTTSAWSQTGSHSTGIDSRLMNSVSLYPNPATNHVDVLVSDNDVTVSRLEVYDVYGKLLNEVEVVDNPTRIDVSFLASGVYFVKVITGEGVATKTFVKK